MVYVRLNEEWTDEKGVTYPAGEEVDVDAATLATLQAAGIVAGENPDWVGATGGKVAAAPPAPTGGEGTDWVGATGGKDV
jgi:hypothetical protein